MRRSQERRRTFLQEAGAGLDGTLHALAAREVICRRNLRMRRSWMAFILTETHTDQNNANTDTPPSVCPITGCDVISR